MVKYLWMYISVQNSSKRDHIDMKSQTYKPYVAINPKDISLLLLH